ncbi:MAG: hypothetical protein N3E49_09240 [Bacteroidia bacterium]|nr:hypothetical protein [Bacteroidia bacterium]
MRGAVLLVMGWVWAQEPANQPVPYTLADRDRLIRVETELTAFKEQYRQEMASLRGEINELRNQLSRMESRSDTQFYALLSSIGVLIASVISLIGFILWDRRKALEPVEREISQLRQDTARLTRLVQSLREYARTHPDLAEILRRYELV